MLEQNQNEIIIDRTFDAPRDILWKAWTTPQAMMLWWGPKDFSAPVIKMDLRVGGKYLYCMRSLEGQDFWSTGVYEEIVPMERIVCTDSFADAAGNIVPASHYGMIGEFPLTLEVTITFADAEDGRTLMTLRHVGIPESESAMCRLGWDQSFDKLAESLRQL